MALPRRPIAVAFAVLMFLSLGPEIDLGLDLEVGVSEAEAQNRRRGRRDDSSTRGLGDDDKNKNKNRNNRNGNGADRGDPEADAYNVISSIRRASKYDLEDPNLKFYGVNLPDTLMYRGVIPNVRDWLPHLRNNPLAWQRGKRRNRLTWVGFKKMNDKTRVFIQTGRPAAYNVVRTATGEVHVILENTQSTISNWHRNMDTRWFPRSIEGIDTFRMRGKRVRVEIDLRVAANYNVTTDGNYIYIDFDDRSLEKTIDTTTGKRKQDTIYSDPNN